MEWTLYGIYIAAFVAFLAAELTAFLGGKDWTVSDNLKAINREHGWWTRTPMLAAILLLTTHIFVGWP